MNSDGWCPLLGRNQNESESICKTELASLKKHLGIEATPVRSDLLEWVAKIKGLEGTLWEGGVLSLSLYYLERSSKFPPQVVFNTVPFHPNVDKDTGEVCISFPHTGSKWDSSSTFNILRFIQHMLSYPLLEDPINLEAAEMFSNRPHVYRDVVEQCLKVSQALERKDSAANEANPKKNGRLVWMISFEEYLHAWIKTATSKGGPHNERTGNIYEHWSALHGCFRTTVEHQPQKQSPYTEACFEKIKSLRYGPPQKHQRKRINRQKVDKLKQIQQMRKLYQLYSTTMAEEPLQACPAAPPATAQCPGGPECWETEVDTLVAWTYSLSLEELEEDHSSKVMVTPLRA